MASKLLLALVSFFISIALFSQRDDEKFTLAKGPENEGKHSYIDGVIGVTSSGVIIARYQKKDLYLELLDEKAAVAKSVLLKDLEYNGHDKKYVGAFILNDKLFLRFSAYDKKKKMAYGLIDEYDPSSLSFMNNVSNESVNVEGMKRVYWYGAGLGRAFSEMAESGFHISNNSKFIIDYSSAFEKDKTTDENIALKVYDNEMQVIWEKEFTIPYANDLFQIKSVIVDDRGNAHLLGKEYLDRSKSSRRGKTGFKYHVISFMNEGTKVKDNALEISGHFITDAAMGITADGFLVASGFYGSTNVFSMDGSFSIKIDIDAQKVISTNKKEFGKEFIQLGMSDREKKKSDKKEDKGQDLELPDFDLDHLLLMPDGGWILLAEQFYITTRTYTTPGPNGSMSTRTVTVYNYDDIIAVKMNSSGEIEWNVKVTKHQSSQGGTSMLSYAWANCNNNIYLVYNSYPFSKDNVVYASVITADGSITKETVMSDTRDELSLHPAYSERIKNCKLLLYSAKRNDYQFSYMNMRP